MHTVVHPLHPFSPLQTFSLSLFSCLSPLFISHSHYLNMVSPAHSLCVSLPNSLSLLPLLPSITISLLPFHPTTLPFLHGCMHLPGMHAWHGLFMPSFACFFLFLYFYFPALHACCKAWHCAGRQHDHSLPFVLVGWHTCILHSAFGNISSLTLFFLYLFILFSCFPSIWFIYSIYMHCVIYIHYYIHFSFLFIAFIRYLLCLLHTYM